MQNETRPGSLSQLNPAADQSMRVTARKGFCDVRLSSSVGQLLPIIHETHQSLLPLMLRVVLPARELLPAGPRTSSRRHFHDCYEFPVPPDHRF